eukprot:sb/3478136/
MSASIFLLSELGRDMSTSLGLKLSVPVPDGPPGSATPPLTTPPLPPAAPPPVAPVSSVRWVAIRRCRSRAADCSRRTSIRILSGRASRKDGSIPSGTGIPAGE